LVQAEHLEAVRSVTLAPIQFFLQLHPQAAVAAASITQQEMQAVQAAVAVALAVQVDWVLLIKAEQVD
jgi:hypothetical protein